MTKKVLFSNKMLVLLQKYTKKGETHTLPLTFPPFWACSMSCFETILFRHSGFPGAANMPPGTLSLPFWGSAKPGPLYAAAKSQGRFFPPACTPPGPNDSGPSASGGMCPLDKGRTRVLYRLFSFPCMGQKIVWGRKTLAIPYAALGANVLLPPLLQRPPGVQERLQQNGAVIHRHAARLFDPEGFLL